MSLNIQNYYGYNAVKLGYVKGKINHLAICHDHDHPKKIGKIFNEMTYEELCEWHGILERCIIAINAHYESKLDRNDKNYKMLKNFGVAGDAILLGQIEAERLMRKGCVSVIKDCSNCKKLTEKIENLEKVEELPKKKKCCSFW